jgi:hypothetical protein
VVADLEESCVAVNDFDVMIRDREEVDNRAA